MRVVLDHDRATLLHGDSKDLGQVLGENSVDAIVCDPPAGIAFMGKGWDKDKGGRDAWVKWLADTIAPSFRALKPGGHAFAWALPRTSHWTATALEDAGFELRDVHHDLRAVDVEMLREILESLDQQTAEELLRIIASLSAPIYYHLFGSGFPKSLTSASAPIPEGAGTALKPAAEHWILARKPLDGTVGEVYAKYRTAVLNIDACRIGDEQTVTHRAGHSGDHGVYGADNRVGTFEHSAAGRWPAHVSLDEEAAAMLDEQSGEAKPRKASVQKHTATYNVSMSGGNSARDVRIAADAGGGASRFFYVAKPPKSETEAGLDHLPKKSGGEATGREDDSAGVRNPRAGAGRGGGRANFHPTKKSVDLMRWLIRLITPPGGIVLDPFAGSGGTGVAAIAEGCSFVGCELTDEYLPILEGRIRHALGEPAPAPAR